MSLPLIVLRAVVLYLSIIVATRLLRFRHVGIMAKHNYLVAAGVVGAASTGILDPQTSLVRMLAVLSFFTMLGLSLSFLDLKLPQALRDKPIPLISYGRMEKKQLRKANMTIENLLGQLRLKGFFDLESVESALLETTGRVSATKKSEAQPVSRQQMKLPSKMAVPPIKLIYDGEVITDNLEKLALNRQWLEIELQKQGFSSPKEVFFAALLQNGSLYLCSH
ncbi:MAG: DUF421 domain-containing protein [Firmicutes bacterium]|nr:DUF421 domain-containing protein [Bacillota bacterium]